MPTAAVATIAVVATIAAEALSTACTAALVRHQLRRIARGTDPVLGARPAYALVRDNLCQTRALRRYRSSAGGTSLTARSPDAHGV